MVWWLVPSGLANKNIVNFEVEVVLMHTLDLFLSKNVKKKKKKKKKKL